MPGLQAPPPALSAEQAEIAILELTEASIRAIKLSKNRQYKNDPEAVDKLLSRADALLAVALILRVKGS